MIVLGLESTCDETACAIVRDGTEILSNIVSSQINLHVAFGGVVPELACRRHVDVMIPVIDNALTESGVRLEEIDLIAVANGPGLIGALLLGLNTAKSLSLAINKPFIGVNHIEAHLYAALMSQHTVSYPCLGVVLSGGHTSLVLMHSIHQHQIIAQTVDDAIGEAFDKVAKILSLPYPGGPEIEILAKQGNPFQYPFRAGNVKGSPLDFSFSGLKTAVLYAVRDFPPTSNKDKSDIAASFQRAAFEDVIRKALLAAEKYGCKTLLFGGGVTNSQRLRNLFAEKAANYTLLWPTDGLSLDNAAMIAGLGYHKFQQRGQGDNFSLLPFTR